MALQTAEKIVIITEKIIYKGICDILERYGASGYTVVPAGGKGSRAFRSTSERASVVDDFANIKVEVIVKDKALGEAIMRDIDTKYFTHYSGITYLDTVEILRADKFHPSHEFQ